MFLQIPQEVDGTEAVAKGDYASVTGICSRENRAQQDPLTAGLS